MYGLQMWDAPQSSESCCRLITVRHLGTQDETSLPSSDIASQMCVHMYGFI